jgi:hypothetical protein
LKVQILLGYQQTLTAVNDLVMRGRGSHEEEEGWLTFTYDPKDFKLIHHITGGGVSRPAGVMSGSVWAAHTTTSPDWSTHPPTPRAGVQERRYGRRSLSPSHRHLHHAPVPQLLLCSCSAPALLEALAFVPCGSRVGFSSPSFAVCLPPPCFY